LSSSANYKPEEDSNRYVECHGKVVFDYLKVEGKSFMKKSSVYFFVLLTLLSLGLTLVPSAFSQTNQLVSSGENGNLQLTMALEKTVYSLGEPVNLTLTITNISNQTINFTHTGLDFDFQVYNDTNNAVYHWSNFRAIAQFIAIVPLPAGESLSTNFTWLQTCNFNASVQGDPVSPGTYNIIGQTGPTYGIQTTPIQLTIALAPTFTPTPTPTPTPSPTTEPATTDTGATIDLAISGNVTSSQMSNVTITTNQSTTSTIVSFTLTGQNGTTGFSNITIPINAVPYGTTPTIYIDGQPIDSLKR